MSTKAIIVREISVSADANAEIAKGVDVDLLGIYVAAGLRKTLGVPTTETSQRESPEVKIIDVNEDLGSYVTVDLRKTLEVLLEKNNINIIVNLRHVRHINSTAIGTLVSATKRLRQKGGDLKLCGLTDYMKRTFDLIGASSVLKIYMCESSALSDF